MTEFLVRPVAPTFDEVYRAHADAVYRFCVSQLTDLATAEDVTGDVFASAFAVYERVQPDSDGVRPWLFRIARNAVVDQHRREGRRRALLGRLGAPRDAPGPEEEAERRDELRSIRRAIGSLRRRDRQLVGLRIAAGLSFAEIAHVTGMREPAARAATHRALARVRAHLKEQP